MAILVHHFEQGGWGMYPLVACMVVLASLTLERAYALHGRRARSAALLHEIALAIRRGDVAAALSIASASEGPTQRIARAALLHWRDDREVLERAIELQLDRELVPLARRMRAFGALALLALVLGLLGSVLGIMQSLTPSCSEGGSWATMLARGIAESLNCSALGLFVAAYAIAAGAVIHGTAQRIADELSLSAQELCNLMLVHRAELRWRSAPHEHPGYRH